MTKTRKRNDSREHSDHTPHKVHLPGFVSDEEIGLGDVIKRATSYIGIKPCGGCERRAAALNRWLVLTRRAR
jgi:hypothetical protein